MQWNTQYIIEHVGSFMAETHVHWNLTLDMEVVTDNNIDITTTRSIQRTASNNPSAPKLYAETPV